MAIFNNQDPQRENNVGQFGATDESIGAYKQAAEYAKDAEYWAKLSQQGIESIDELLKVVEELYKKGELQAEEIEQLKQDFADQDARLMQLISETHSAVTDANNAIQIIDQKIIEVQKQLDILLAMDVQVATLPPGTPASGSFDPTTGLISLGIPEGNPGKDGSVKDLDTAPIGVPDPDDWGFYVESTDNIVHKAKMSDIAKTFPSVQSVSYNGGNQKETGDINITKTKLGLGNVLDVASYSKTESDNTNKGYIKTYPDKTTADTDAKNRKVGETILIWNGTSYDFYSIESNTNGNKLSDTPTKSEKRIVTVNLKEPDSTGNIDIIVPTGNPSLYLGELLMFPYDPDQPVTYQGVLPADGRLLSRVGNEDLVASLISGKLPVVSELEWQAGAKTYFSWGPDGTSTTGTQLRLPDWTGGTAIRSPDAVGDLGYDGSALSQIPYVATVNGKAPNDTGAITLVANDIGAIPSTAVVSISQGGTGASDTVTARTNLGVDSLLISGTETFVQSPNKAYKTSISDSGVFSVKSSAGAITAIPVESGGTGAATAVGARTNLGLKSGSVNDVGTSGATIPLLNGNNTWSGSQTFSSTINGSVNGTSTNVTGTVLLANGGTGATTAAAARSNLGVAYGTSAGTVTEGNDSRLNTVSGKSGGSITSQITVEGAVFAATKSASDPANGTEVSGPAFSSNYIVNGITRAITGLAGKYKWGDSNARGQLDVALINDSGTYVRGATYIFGGDGNATAPGTWAPNSDERLKYDINRIDNPLEKMKQIRGVSWKRLDGVAPGIGFIAQEVKNVFPDNVFVSGDRTLTDGTVVKDVLSPDTSGVAAALHHEAILALMEKVEQLTAQVQELQNK